MAITLAPCAGSLAGYDRSMRRRIGKPSVPALAYFGVLIAALVIGLVVGGGVGGTIAAISAAILALTILGAVGIGKAAGDAVDGRGRRPGPEPPGPTLKP